MDLKYQHICMVKRNYLLHYAVPQHYLDMQHHRWIVIRKQKTWFHRSERLIGRTILALPDDNVAVNGMLQTSASSTTDFVRPRLDQSVQSEDLNSGLVQSIHDAARTIELALLDHRLVSKSSWLSMAWLGVDKTTWVKPLAYQAAVDSILQAMVEISARGNGSGRDVNLLIQRSLSRLRAPLEDAIQEQLTQRESTLYDWYLTDQNPRIIESFVKLLENDPTYSAATTLSTLCYEDTPGSTSSGDLELLVLSLCCLASIMKLGLSKISCQKFSLTIPDTVGRFMDKLLDFIPINEAYQSMKDIGLHRDFLRHFGPRAAWNDHGVAEISFWLDLIQKKLQRAIDREKIWSRLTTSESIEVLEKDLAIFGFFIALGRSTQVYISKCGVTISNDSISSILRYLIGGSVLYYPQLSSISSYQLYVEVVCEELDWLPFYTSDMPTTIPDNDKESNESDAGEVVLRILDVCSYWMTSFIKYSSWVQNPSNIKAARYVSRGHAMLSKCSQDFALWKLRKGNQVVKNQDTQSAEFQLIDAELKSFDKALESVEEAVVRLENLLRELHVSNSNSGKEQLQAACSDLERIRKLKKEAEFLEASFRAKAASLEQADPNDLAISSASTEDLSETNIKRNTGTPSGTIARGENKSRNFWSFLIKSSSGKRESGEDTYNDSIMVTADYETLKSNDLHRFKKLRNELIELEKRVQKSADDALNEEIDNSEDTTSLATSEQKLVPAAHDNVISKSMKKIKDTTTVVLQGSQLLAIDTAAAMALLQRSVIGDELTQKERQALQRTLTDLASVVPIGILMLLPVTAVGHAAMLAFIQRYIPSLIPSTYGPERLELLRQLEKVKEMNSTESIDELSAEVVSSGSEAK